MNSNLISIVIPAYNLPIYTEKTINSIISQTYRPIEIILSDDNSPNSLVHISNKVLNLNDNDLTIKYYRQTKNLGYYWNLNFAISKANGKYLLMLDHDDWLVDNRFLTDSLTFLKNNINCNLTICNTLNENSLFPFFNLSNTNWITINGMNFISNYLFNNVHPSRSAIIFNLDKLNNLGYKNFFIKKNSINFMPDEAFVSIMLLASIGDIGISGKIVSIRGIPDELSVSRTKEWNSNIGIKSFIQYIKLYYYFKNIKSNSGMKLMINLILKINPLQKFNYTVFKVIKIDRVAIILMFASVFRKNLLNLVFLFRILIYKCKKYFFYNIIDFIIK